jgi:hypothetical protein
MLFNVKALSTTRKQNHQQIPRRDMGDTAAENQKSEN